MPIKRNEVNATIIAHSGAVEVAAIVEGYRVAKTYYGYTKREAITLYLKEVNAIVSKVRN